MKDLFEVMKWMLGCGTLLMIAFIVLLSLPKSQLRSFLMPVIGWAMAIFCGIYAVSPIDVIPEAVLGPIGLIDDICAVLMGIAAARAAMNAKSEGERVIDREYKP